ncbi:MAG TPA: hypothetical protein VF060_25135 [Trebonia sp.]
MESKKAFIPAIALTALALTASACTSGATPASQSGTGTAGTGTTANHALAVTAGQARQVFDGYVSQTASALAAGDRQAALGLTQFTQWDELNTAFLTAAADHTTVRPDRYTAPSFYLPVQDGYPRWFVASARRTAAASSPASLPGVPRAATGQVLMVFEKRTAQLPWELTSSVQLQPGQQLPKLATTAGGYVETAPFDDSTTYLARPDVVGPLQAAVVDDGPAAPASAAVASGPLTTGIYASQAAIKPPSGDVRQWELEGSKYDKFALRTASGGAVVFYAMYLNATTEVPAELSEKSDVPAGPPIAVPPELLPLLKPGAPVARKRLIAQYALVFAAVDPPAAAPNAKIQVIAMGGTPNYVSGS